MNGIIQTHEEILRLRDNQARRQMDRQRHDDKARQKEEDRNDTEDGLLQVAVTAIQMMEIEIRETLQTYQAATIMALEENREALEEVQRQRQDMLDQAYVMEDGKRVFKSEDGERVFDEHGKRVGGEELDPNLISERHPSWEAFSETNERLEELEGERQDLLDYQERLDETEDKLDQRGLSEDGMNGLELDLERNMPASIRRHAAEINGADYSAHSENFRTSFDTAAAALAAQPEAGLKAVMALD